MAMHRTRYGSSTATSTCWPPHRRDNPLVQVTRNRRVGGKLPLPVGRKARVITATSAALLLALTGTSIAYPSSHFLRTDHVGTTVPHGLVLSDNQIINPS